MIRLQQTGSSPRNSPVLTFIAGDGGVSKVLGSGEIKFGLSFAKSIRKILGGSFLQVLHCEVSVVLCLSKVRADIPRVGRSSCLLNRVLSQAGQTPKSHEEKNGKPH